MQRQARLLQKSSEFFSAILPAVNAAYNEVYGENETNFQEHAFIPIANFLQWLIADSLLTVYNITTENHNHRLGPYVKLLDHLRKHLDSNLERLFAFYIKSPRLYRECDVTVKLYDDIVEIIYDSWTVYDTTRT